MPIVLAAELIVAIFLGLLFAARAKWKLAEAVAEKERLYVEWEAATAEYSNAKIAENTVRLAVANAEARLTKSVNNKEICTFSYSTGME